MMFLVHEGQDSKCHCLNSPLLIISKAHGMPFSYIQNFRTQTQSFSSVSNEGFPISVTHKFTTTYDGNYIKNIASPSRKSDEKEKEKRKKNGSCKAFCVTRKHKNNETSKNICPELLLREDHTW